MTNFSEGDYPRKNPEEFWGQPLTVNDIIRRYSEMQALRPHPYVLEATSVQAEGESLRAKFDDFQTAVKMATLLHETGYWIVDSLERQ